MSFEIYEKAIKENLNSMGVEYRNTVAEKDQISLQLATQKVINKELSAALKDLEVEKNLLAARVKELEIELSNRPVPDPVFEEITIDKTIEVTPSKPLVNKRLIFTKNDYSPAIRMAGGLVKNVEIVGAGHLCDAIHLVESDAPTVIQNLKLSGTFHNGIKCIDGSRNVTIERMTIPVKGTVHKYAIWGERCRDWLILDSHLEESIGEATVRFSGHDDDKDNDGVVDDVFDFPNENIIIRGGYICGVTSGVKGVHGKEAVRFEYAKDCVVEGTEVHPLIIEGSLSAGLLPVGPEIASQDELWTTNIIFQNFVWKRVGFGGRPSVKGLIIRNIQGDEFISDNISIQLSQHDDYYGTRGLHDVLIENVHLKSSSRRGGFLQVKDDTKNLTVRNCSLTMPNIRQGHWSAYNMDIEVMDDSYRFENNVWPKSYPGSWDHTLNKATGEVIGIVGKKNISAEDWLAYPNVTGDKFV